MLTIGLLILLSINGQAQSHHNAEDLDLDIRSVPERILSLIEQLSPNSNNSYSLETQPSSQVHEILISDEIHRVDFTVTNNTGYDQHNVQLHVNTIPSWIETIEVKNPGDIASGSSVAVSYFFKTNNIKQASERIDRATFSITTSQGRIWDKELELKAVLPLDFQLFDNYPNPFNPTTNIRYSLPEKGTVTIEIFNILGQKVIELVNEVQDAGSYTKKWDASNVASGMYLYRMSVSAESGKKFFQNKKMLLIK